MMSAWLKECVGRSAYQISRTAPGLRGYLRSIGLRMNQEWCGRDQAQVFVPDGQRIQLTHLDESYLAFEWFWKGWQYYEPVFVLLFLEMLQSRDAFIDIGANIGYYSLIAARVRPDVKVVAFEPNPRLFGFLSENIKANEFAIKAEPMAADEGSDALELRR